MPGIVSYGERVRPILAAIRTTPVPSRVPLEAPAAVIPFITISREAGAGGWTLAQSLTDALNASLGEAESPWTCWERQLVEKVAADYHLSAEIIESLETGPHSWLGDFLSSLKFSDDTPYADEARVYGRVAATIRALAKTGKVVIVGRGGAFVSRTMPGGIHIRLVAPLPWRISHMAQYLTVSEREAAEHVRELEHNREAFYRRYWPKENFTPEAFTVTFNTAEIEQGTIVEMIKALVNAKTRSSKSEGS